MQTVEIYKAEEKLRRLRMSGGDERELRRLEKELKRRRRARKALLIKEELAAQAKQKRAERDIKRMLSKHSGKMKYFRTELQKGVAQLYKDAVQLYKSGSYDLAKEILMEVEELWPDYKLTRKYLELIDKEKGTAL
jgi:TolA-binding protein